jgi:hypothetical protein
MIFFNFKIDRSITENNAHSCSVAQWTSHPPKELQTRVRFPPGYKEFKAILLCIIDLPTYYGLFVCWKGEIETLSQ